MYRHAIDETVIGLGKFSIRGMVLGFWRTGLAIRLQSHLIAKSGEPFFGKSQPRPP